MLVGLGLALWRGAVAWAVLLILAANVMPTFAPTTLSDEGAAAPRAVSLVQAYGGWSVLLFCAPLAVACAVGALLGSTWRWGLATAWSLWAVLAGACVLALLTVGAAAAPVPVLLLGALLRAGVAADRAAVGQRAHA